MISVKRVRIDPPTTNLSTNNLNERKHLLKNTTEGISLREGGVSSGEGGVSNGEGGGSSGKGAGKSSGKGVGKGSVVAGNSQLLRT